MLDSKRVYENLEAVREKLRFRHAEVDWERFVALFEKRKLAIRAFEEGRAQQKVLSAAFQSAPKGEGWALKRDELKQLSLQIKEFERDLAAVEDELSTFMLYVPNIPHESVPLGESEADNVVVRTVGEPVRLPFEGKAHWDVGAELGVLDLETAARISGARFALYKGMGAILEMGLAMFMVTHAQRRGYTPVFPPFMVTRECMVGTGQLPKFEEEAFSTDGLYLIPTAEVPVTNMYRGELLDQERLPLKYVAYSSCFRREAGSAGKDTRGITRLHQFQKVELVKFVEPENSYGELEALVQDAESILQELELPYRVVALSAGDMGFSAAKCYDIEVWLAGQNRYREISSCSNFEDYQARRANIRYRPLEGKKTAFVHTINGSGLAVGRTIVALLENFQQADGSVIIPKALRPFVGGVEILEPAAKG